MNNETWHPEPLFLDTETYSDIPLKNGTWNYAAADEAEVMIVTWAIGYDEPVEIWDRTRGEPMPLRLQQAIYDARRSLVIQNSYFDRTVMRITNLFPGAPITTRRICDTMVQALAHGMPGSLEKIGALFGLSEDEGKMKEGRSLIHFFCKPQRGGKRNTEATHPERWGVMREYAKRDITTMRIIHRKLPRWNYPGVNFPQVQSQEHIYWCIDQTINDRGFAVDLDLADKAVDASAEEKATLNARTLELTEGEVKAATQRDLLLRYILEAHGVQLLDMKADTLQRRVDDPDLPREVRELLDLRLQSSRNTAAKYKPLLTNTAWDGRLHGSLQFCGAAGTGRDAGRVFQPQNLMRPTMTHAAIEMALAAVKSGVVTLLYSNVPEVLGNCVRGVIIAPPGRKLIVLDYSSIEGRGLAWLASEDPVIEFYHAIDRGDIKYDAYMLAYASVFGGNPGDVTKKQRTVGKPIELAFGYGGGVAAFLTFALTYHLDLDELSELIWDVGDPAHLAECEKKHEWAKKHGYHGGMGKRKYAAFEYVKQKWRAARPRTVELWDSLAQGFKMAIAYENQTFEAGVFKFRRAGQWTRMRLPSGRSLCFLQAKSNDDGITYRGLDRYTRRWKRVHTHGGKMAGLGTQAFARDLLFSPLPELEEAGYETVLRVHDELIAEAPDTDDFTLDGMREIMCRPRVWAPGMPLAADGFEAYRYRKE